MFHSTIDISENLNQVFFGYYIHALLFQWNYNGFLDWRLLLETSLLNGDNIGSTEMNDDKWIELVQKFDELLKIYYTVEYWYKIHKDNILHIQALVDYFVAST